MSKTKWERTKVQNLLRNGASGVYYARFSVAGKQKWRSLKTEVFSVAKLRLADLQKEEREKAARLGAAARGKMTVAAAAESYREQVAASPNLKPSSKKARLDGLRKLERTWPELFKMDCRRVGKLEVQRWAKTFRETGTGFTPPGARPRAKRRPASASSFNKAVDTLRRVFDVAVEAGAIYQNPAAGIKRAKEQPKNVRLPTREQFARFVAEIAGSGAAQAADCAHLVEFLAYSGCRVGEARRLTWGDIDHTRGLLRVFGEKTDTYRTVPVTPPLRDLIGRMRERRGEEPDSWPVHRVREAQKSMDRAAAAVGMHRITQHDLRHFFATVAIESGVDVPTVARWLGHKDGGALLMKRYGHLRDEHSAAAALKVTFDAPAGEEEGKTVEFKRGAS